MQRGNTLADEFLADLGEELEEKVEDPDLEDGNQEMAIDDEAANVNIKDVLEFVYGDRLRGIIEVK